MNNGLITNGSDSTGIVNGSGSGIASVSFADSPKTYTSTTGSDTYYTNFSVADPHGNYTLFVRNGDLLPNGSNNNASSSSEVWLNGVQIFGPSNFKNQGGLLKKNLSVGTENQIKVVMKSKPGSQINVWVEDESPDIVLTSPMGDTVTDGTILFAGYTTDRNVTSVTVTQSNNTTATTIPVSNGNFSASLWIHAPVQLNVSAIDRTDTLRTTTLDLDGDCLPMKAELLYGFDPLNPDSNSTLSSEDLAGNGIPDGFETLNNSNGELLPVFIKYLIHGDPLKVDSNDNGLTDYFELLELHDMNVSSNSSEEMALPNEDPDHDGLTNIQEQALGTDPLNPDTDSDGLTDGYEVNVSHTDPLNPDTDGDGLDDAAELKLGTNPNKPDTYGDDILDGKRTFTTTASDNTLGINVSVNGVGDMSKHVRIVQEISPYYTNNSALVSPLVYVEANASFNYAIVSMNYDPSVVTDPANYSLCYYNESLGLFLPVNSTVDPVNHTISANVTHLSTWGIFNLNILQNIYSTVASFNDQIAGYVNGSANIVQNVFNDLGIPITVTKTYSVDPNTNSVIVGDSVTFSNTNTTVQGSNSTPASTAQKYSISVTMNQYGVTNWFDNGANFPVGVYQINATGWYTHWSPVPSELACVDQGLDRGVRMYAWSDRGTNANTNGIRWGMHIKYGSNDVPVFMVRIEPGTLQINHSGGPIGMWDLDQPGCYADNTYQLQYVLSYAGQSVSSLNMNDSDGDGLPDDMEIHGWMDTRENTYKTDPYDPDTDGDGLTDGQEAGTWTTVNGMKYFKIVSDPTKADTDGDGVSDYDEVNGHDIYVANTHDSALKVSGAVSQADAFQYLNKVHVTSDPLINNTDNDGLDDGKELKMGTDPRNPDTDGDGIRDNMEASVGEDPTIFDITPPAVSSNLYPYSKDAYSPFAEYHFIYTVTDSGGVKHVALVKQGRTWDDFTSTSRDQTSVYRDIDFTNGDVLLNSLMTVSVYINSEDWNGNSGSYLAWRQYSAFARAASTITTGTIYDDASASSLGAFAGMTASVGQFSELATEAWNDPSIIPGIVSMVAVLSVNKEAQAIFLASLPVAIDQMEETENPYSKDTQPKLHDDYATAWKLSYVGSNLALFFAGSEALSTAKTSAQVGTIFQDSSILNKIEESKSYFAEQGSFGVEGEMKASLAEGAVTTGLTDSEAADIIAQETTMSKRIEAVEFMDKLTPDERAMMEGHLSEVDEILKDMTPADAASLAADSTFQDIMSLEDLQGVPHDKMVDLRANLVDAYHKGTITQDQAEKYVSTFKELGTHNNVIGLENAVDKIIHAKSNNNFYGSGNEVETALEYLKISGNTVEITKEGYRYDLKVARLDGTIEYIELKKANPTGYLGTAKLENLMKEAQDKFSDPNIDYSKGTTVLEINAEEGTIGLDVNNIDNLINNEINPTMNAILNDPNLPPRIRNQNYIGKIKIVLPNEDPIIVIRDGNGFKKP